MDAILEALFAGVISPVIVGLLWKWGLDVKAKASMDADKVLKRFPRVEVAAHGILTEAKKEIPAGAIDNLVSYVALGLKTSIKGKLDDIIIDAIAKKIVESRKH